MINESHDDGFSHYVEYVGFLAGLAGLRCRRVWRREFEFDGEMFPGYWEYEARHRGEVNRAWTFDDNLGRMFLEGDDNEKAAIGEVVLAELKRLLSVSAVHFKKQGWTR